MTSAGVLVRPLGQGPELPLLKDGVSGKVTAAVWPGIGAKWRSMVSFILSAEASTVSLWHEGESVYYVWSGSGYVSGDDVGGELPLKEGSIVHVGGGTAYRFVAGVSGLEFIGGPCPPDPAWYTGLEGGVPGTDRSSAAEGSRNTDKGSAIQVLDRDEPALMLPIVSSDARMIAWPGNGAWVATMNYVKMEPGEANVPHTHPDSEDTIVILEGRGTIDDLSAGRTYEFHAGDVIHVPAGVRHAVQANRDSPVVSVGGPCPADIGFLRACGAELPDRPT